MIVEKEKLFISPEKGLIEALKRMDELDMKLLIVMEDSHFKGLLSIGDIQRYFVKTQSFDAIVKDAMRKSYKVATVEDPLDEIKETMMQYRMEYMPILNANRQLVKLLFWEEVFGDKKISKKQIVDVPVVIMAGGQGTRLRPITHIIPKPLVPIGDRPILQIIVEKFRETGCHEFHLSLNYKADMIKTYFEDEYGNDDTISFNYFEEEKPMGTVGSVSLIKDSLMSTFFISNCDCIIDQDYSEVYKFHVENNHELTAVAFVNEVEIPYGTFEIGSDGLLESLVEKPKYNFLVNAGLYILEPHLLEEIPNDGMFHITQLMQKIIDRNGRVGVFPISAGSWMDIGQWPEYQKTLKRFGSEINF